jgi:hypothetical protein
MKQISSLTSHLQKSFDFIRSFMIEKANTDDFYFKRLEIIKNGSIGCERGSSCLLHIAAISWLFWNDHISKYADKRFKIENIEDLMEYTCRLYLDRYRKGYETVINRPESRNQKEINKETASTHCLNYLEVPKNDQKQHLQKLLNRSIEMYGMLQLDKDDNIIYKYAKKLLPYQRKEKPYFVKSSNAHRNHGKYSISDIMKIDDELAKRIEQAATSYGYISADSC